MRAQDKNLHSDLLGTQAQKEGTSDSPGLEPGGGEGRGEGWGEGGGGRRGGGRGGQLPRETGGRDTSLQVEEDTQGLPWLGELSL